MPKPLATTEAEIEKLPSGFYLSVAENVFHKKGREWFSTEYQDPSSERWIAKFEGGIQCELVPAAERDELARLLRRLLERGDLPPFREQECWIALDKLDQATVKQPSSDQPCERCGGTRRVGSDCGDFVEACPDCGCKSCDLGTIYGDDGSAKPCPECTEAGA